MYANAKSCVNLNGKMSLNVAQELGKGKICLLTCLPFLQMTLKKVINKIRGPHLSCKYVMKLL